MIRLYRRLLQIICQRELRSIADDYPMTREELIQYYDFMAVAAINEETKAQERVLGISIRTANLLEGKS